MDWFNNEMYIHIKNPRYEPPTAPREFLSKLEELRRLKKTLPNLPSQSARKKLILGCAREMGIKTAKWMFYAPNDEHDEIVDQFKRLVNEGYINIMKYTERMEGKSQVYIVYVEDFDDLEEVNRVFSLLLEEFGERTYFFKPDVYTHMRIYSKDNKLLKPYIFKANKAEYFTSV